MIITGAISAPIRRQCSACLEDHVAAGVLRWDAVSWALAATTLLASASAAVRLSASPIPPSPSFVMFHLTRSSVPRRRERGTGPSPPSCTTPSPPSCMTPSPFTVVTTGSLPPSLDVLIRSLPAMPLPPTTRAAVTRATSSSPAPPDPCWSVFLQINFTSCFIWLINFIFYGLVNFLYMQLGIILHGFAHTVCFLRKN